MYEAFFEMKRLPFVRDVPVKYLYEPPFITETLCRLEHVAENRLFGVVGL